MRIAAGRRLLQERHLEALLAVQECERGTERWYRAWDEVHASGRDLAQYESDLDLVALMQIEIVDPSGPEIRAWLLEAARDRLAGRPWNSPLRR